MGYILQIDEDAQPLASNAGMEELRKWVEGLEHKENVQLVHLFAYGWSQKPQEVFADLKASLKASAPPRKSTADTAKNMLALMKSVDNASQVVSISDGMGKDE